MWQYQRTQSIRKTENLSCPTANFTHNFALVSRFSGDEQHKTRKGCITFWIDLVSPFCRSTFRPIPTETRIRSQPLIRCIVQVRWIVAKTPGKMADSGKPVGRPMKYPYTYTAKLAQFPYKYYFKHSWYFRYWTYSLALTFPLIVFIHNKGRCLPFNWPFASEKVIVRRLRWSNGP